jgi:hypothetical protein
VRRAREFPDLGTPLLEFPSAAYRAVPAIWYYRVIYKVDEDVLYILRVWDTRREPQDLVPEAESPR